MLEDLLPKNIKRNAVGAVIERQIPSFPLDNCNRDGNDNELKTRREYHSVTRGWILNEIFRRADPQGRTIGEYLREEVAPHAADGVFVGVTDGPEEMARLAPVRGWTVQRAALESLVPASLGRRTESSAAGMVKLARRLRVLQKKSGAAAKDNRPPVIEGQSRIAYFIAFSHTYCTVLSYLYDTYNVSCKVCLD